VRTVRAPRAVGYLLEAFFSNFFMACVTASALTCLNKSVPLKKFDNKNNRFKSDSACRSEAKACAGGHFFRGVTLKNGRS